MTIPDAELSALGEQLEEIQKRLGPVREEHHRLGYEVKAYAINRTGYEPGGRSPPGLCEDWLKAMDEMGSRNGFNACDRRLQALYRELDPVMKKIMSIPATSVVGLGVKAMAAFEANDGLWDASPRDLDYDK